MCIERLHWQLIHLQEFVTILWSHKFFGNGTAVQYLYCIPQLSRKIDVYRWSHNFSEAVSVISILLFEVMDSNSSNQCILLNNHAVECFEKGALTEASKWFKKALDTFSLNIPSAEEMMDGQTMGGSVSPLTAMHCWSQSADAVQSDFLDKQGVFLHRRTAYLCPASFRPNLYNNYATFILYNTAVCIHIQSLAQIDCSIAERLLEKAFSLYNMAFSTMKLSRQKNGALLTILFNNSGQLLYRQWRTFEAAKCFRVVRDLLATLPMDSFEPKDFNGLYLNSVMDSNTASAAWRWQSLRNVDN